jgi:hypothetical protein
MRTTLTIDEDVDVQLETLRSRDRRTLKAVVNDALAEGFRKWPAIPSPGASRSGPRSSTWAACWFPRSTKSGAVLDWLDDEESK